jgi:hypothetical protein
MSVLVGADAVDPLEGSAERERAAVADPLGDLGDGEVRLAEQVGGEGETPGGEVADRCLPVLARVLPA